jgi:hypothetical protein
MALAMREFRQHLREIGQSGSYNSPLRREDRSRFLQALESVVQGILRYNRQWAANGQMGQQQQPQILRHRWD